MNVVVYSGSFDPPHEGHAENLRKLLSMPNIDRICIVLVPSTGSKIKKASMGRRVRILEAEFGKLLSHNPKVEVIVPPSNAKRGNWASGLFALLRERYPKARFLKAIGTDRLDHLDRFIKDGFYEKFIVLKRGWPNEDELLRKAIDAYPGRLEVFEDIVPASSTEVRRRVRSKGHPKKVSSKTRRLIRARRLYK
ncbi:MAG: hypothetical protein COT15_02660 [Candidatus Diapherotrites archaeon CG08_land_8_20_14_0_20_34_12]|nr:MAG: hypothetical protein COT15_02660 [Candidatus Diapherotrites archaeon CG08_land_8_20_14_0_20_34_12]